MPLKLSCQVSRESCFLMNNLLNLIHKKEKSLQGYFSQTKLYGDSTKEIKGQELRADGILIFVP